MSSASIRLAEAKATTRVLNGRTEAEAFSNQPNNGAVARALVEKVQIF